MYAIRSYYVRNLKEALSNNEQLIKQIGKEKEAAYIMATHDKSFNDKTLILRLVKSIS